MSHMAGHLAARHGCIRASEKAHDKASLRAAREAPMRCSNVILLPKRASRGTNTRSYTGMSPMMARMLNSCSDTNRLQCRIGPDAWLVVVDVQSALQSGCAPQYSLTGWLLV